MRTPTPCKINIRVSEEIQRQILNDADARRISKSDVVREILELHYSGGA